MSSSLPTATIKIVELKQKLQTAKDEEKILGTEFDALMQETFVKQAESENASGLSEDEQADKLKAYLAVAKDARDKSKELKAKQTAVEQLETQLRVEQQTISHHGQTTTATPISETITPAMLKAIGFEDQQQSFGTATSYVVVFEKGSTGKDVKLRTKLDEEMETRVDEPLDMGYGNGETGLTASCVVQNQHFIENDYPTVMYRYDMGNEMFTYLPGDLNESNPKLGFVNGTRVPLTAPAGVLSIASVARSATFIRNYTKTGVEGDGRLRQIAKKISSPELYDRVKEEFDQLPEDQRLGQVLLFMVLREATLVDSTTLAALEKWIEQKDLLSLYGGDIAKFVKVCKAVLTLLVQYHKLPFQPARMLLDIFLAVDCKGIAEPFGPVKQKYIADHALETEIVGGHSDAYANQHYNECITVLDLAKKLFHQEMRAGNYSVTTDGIPSGGSLNTFSHGDSDGVVEYRWYPKEEYAKLSDAQRKKLRAMIKKRGPAPGTPDEFKKDGQYSRKPTWSKSPGARSAVAKEVRKSGGVKLINGQLNMWCGKCGINPTHTTGGHATWSRDPGAYCLPAKHPGRALMAKGPTNLNTSTGNEPSYADLLKQVKEMQSSFKHVAALSSVVLEAEAEVDPDPAAAAKRRELVQAWKAPSFLN